MSNATITLVAGNPAVLLPPGEYYVGDPCYANVDHARWMRQLRSVWDLIDNPNASFRGDYGTIAMDPDGPTWWAAHGTRWGDGCYWDNDGREYGVDAGLLGVVPVAYAEPNALNGLHLVTFDRPFSITYSEEDEGTVSIGHIDIKTDPKDEYDPYGYLDECDECGSSDGCECEETDDEEEDA